MINLLPPSLIYQNLTEYRRRRLMLGLSLLIMILAALLVVELFYLASIKIKTDGLMALPPALTADDFRRQHETSRAMQAIKRDLKILAPLTQNNLPSAQLTSLLSLRPAGVKLTAIQYARPDTGGQTLTIAGIAKDREVLLEFIAKLETWPDLAKIRSPLDNLIRGRDLAFSINLELK